jgi:hypothetical protein
MIINTRKLSSFGSKISKLGVCYCWGSRFPPLTQIHNKEYLNSQKLKSLSPPHECKKNEHTTTKDILEENNQTMCPFISKRIKAQIYMV